jgi:mannose-6-phosphate isomerase-like protein (cupin superfamily)
METQEQQSKRILDKLNLRYPGKNAYDLSGKGIHFVCEIEPVKDHPEYDKAVEVILTSEPHKHLKMTQVYKVLEGSLTLHSDDKTILLNKDDQYVIEPGKIHWAEGNELTLVEIYSTPGWTKEDHIKV